jgi:hypothetical protein
VAGLLQVSPTDAKSGKVVVKPEANLIVAFQ